MILQLVDETGAAGARQFAVCEVLEIDERTIQRWRAEDGGEDRRRGPNTPPKNKLSPKERAEVLSISNSPEFRDVSTTTRTPSPCSAR